MVFQHTARGPSHCVSNLCTPLATLIYHARQSLLCYGAQHVLELPRVPQNRRRASLQLRIGGKVEIVGDGEVSSLVVRVDGQRYVVDLHFLLRDFATTWLQWLLTPAFFLPAEAT
jgi:hypothetical protein